MFVYGRAVLYFGTRILGTTQCALLALRRCAGLGKTKGPVHERYCGSARIGEKRIGEGYA